MKKIGVITYIWILAGLLIAASIALFILSGFNIVLLIVLLIVIAALSIFGYSLYRRRYSAAMKGMNGVAKTLNASDRYAMMKFPLPVAACDASGVMLWCNRLFIEEVMLNMDIADRSINQFIGSKRIADIAEGKFFETDYRGKSYLAVCEKASEKNDLFVFYFIDNTELKAVKNEYELSRPVAMIISVDGIDESPSLRDSEKAGYLGAVENILETWVAENRGFMRKTDTVKFICIMEEGQYKAIVEKRFEILDRVRNYDYNGHTGATLSIGLGRGKTLPECDDAARQAYDMAMGRGGDQAAVKNEDTFEFYGGISKGVEKRTKVKIRVVASELRELILKSRNVLVMGHRFSDLDSLGASIAMCSAAMAMGKKANIVLSTSATLAYPLVEMLRDNGMYDMIKEPDEALELAGENTLLIVVDTHVKDLLESRDVYDRCGSVAVIDHHRKVVGHIDNALIFHHEPFSSSACEMVTEVLQYMGSKQLIGRVQAEALLAGIMLDTKNFALRTGVRTFEAAAYLRSNGADTVAVRRLFSNSREVYSEKNTIVSNAQIIGSFAVSSVDFESDNVRVVSAQAADEMLDLNGVRASFVLYRSESGVNISARSLGDVNVQLIMEKIGGGGHQTMAAAQIKADSMDEAKTILISAIKEYVSQLNS